LAGGGLDRSVSLTTRIKMKKVKPCVCKKEIEGE
jgi:hypothetical protein